MSITKIHCGGWSASVSQEDPLFTTFFESQKELLGSTPHELHFDDWDWLPNQWDQLQILIGIVGKDWKWNTQLLDLHFSIVSYADVAAIVGAMVDLPKGWETCTVFDKRTSLEDRKRLYRQNGRLILESITAGKEPQWYADMTSERAKKGKVDIIERRIHKLLKMTKSPTDLLVGAMWDAYLKESVGVLGSFLVIDSEAVWSEYGEVLSAVVSRNHVHGSSQPKTVHTLQYLAKPQTLFVSGIQVSTTSDCSVMDQVEVDNGKYFAFKGELYDLSLAGYLASSECDAHALNLKSISIDLKERPSCPIDQYAAQVHAHLITIARARLCNIHKDNRPQKAIPKEYHFAIALFLLSIIGRNAARAMVERLTEASGSTFAHSCFKTWSIYCHDSSFPSKMRKRFREGEFDHLLSILTLPLDSDDSIQPKLSLVDGKWMVTP